MSIEQMRLETGFPGPFTDVPYDLVAHLVTPCWVKTLWASCRKFDISVSDDFGTWNELRSHDVLLMPHFLQNYTMDAALLQTLNLCRLHLHAVSLADLCNMTGDRIVESAYEGTAPATSVRRVEWPRPVPTLTQEDWGTWKLALEQCFLQFASRDHLLSRPLGPWHTEHRDTAPWVFSPSTGDLFHRAEGALHCWRTARGVRVGVGH